MRFTTSLCLLGVAAAGTGRMSLKKCVVAPVDHTAELSEVPSDLRMHANYPNSLRSPLLQGPHHS